MSSWPKCYIHGAASVCPCDPVYATEAEAKDAEIARLREALEWYLPRLVTQAQDQTDETWEQVQTAESELIDDAGARACAALEGK